MSAFARLGLLAGMVLFSASPGQAEPLTIVGDGMFANLTEIAIVGNDNVLTILQEAPSGASEGNIVRVDITGDSNGGPRGASFTGAAFDTGLLPGRLTQSGSGNLIDLAVSGSDNLFAVSQLGSANQLVASIVGSGNQSAVQQFGNHNVAAFSQTGNGNTVSITQRSW